MVMSVAISSERCTTADIPIVSRAGSRTVKRNSTASNRPGIPAMTNAQRQPSAWPAIPPIRKASKIPMFDPATNVAIADVRRSGGYRSEIMECAGEIAPASPIPTPRRARAR